MGEDEVAVVRRAYEAFNAKDADALLDVFHPDPKTHFSPMIAGVEGGYRGAAGVRAWLAEMTETFAESTVTAERFEFVEGGLVVKARGRGRGSDAEVTQRLFHAADVRDGLIRWFAAYHSRDEALAAIRARDAPSRAR